MVQNNFYHSIFYREPGYNKPRKIIIYNIYIIIIIITDNNNET